MMVVTQLSNQEDISLPYVRQPFDSVQVQVGRDHQMTHCKKPLVSFEIMALSLDSDLCLYASCTISFRDPGMRCVEYLAKIGSRSNCLRTKSAAIGLCRN